MRKTRFSEEQIAYALRQAESGTVVPEVCRSWESRSRPSTALGSAPSARVCWLEELSESF